MVKTSIEIKYHDKDYTLHIGDKIGGGNFGNVYACPDTIQDTQLVIKTTTDAPAWIPGMPMKYDVLTGVPPKDSPEAKIPFFRGVVRFFDIVYIDGLYYTVMERLDESLRDLTCVNVNNAYLYIEKLVRNIRKIHESGFCILDIKPANIMVKKFMPYFIDVDFVFQYTKPENYSSMIQYSGTPKYNSVYTLLDYPTYPVDNLISLMISGYSLLAPVPWNFVDCNEFDHDLQITASLELAQLVEWANEIYDHIRELSDTPVNILTKSIYKHSFLNVYEQYYKNDPLFGFKFLFVYLHMIPRKPDTYIDYNFILDVLSVFSSGKITDTPCMPGYERAKINKESFCKHEPVLDRTMKFQFNFDDSWSCALTQTFVKTMADLLTELKGYATGKEYAELERILKNVPTAVCNTKDHNDNAWNFIRNKDYPDLAKRVLRSNKGKVDREVYTEIRSLITKIIYMSDNFRA